jgi:very-short-patch-repair endonuclease
MARAVLGSEAVASGLLTRGHLRWNYRAVYPDVYLHRKVAPTLSDKAIGAWLWSTRRGIVTGRAAAALHGALWIDDATPVELVWANNHSPAGIITYRDRIAEDEVCELLGIAVATPARTALDLGRKLTRDKAVQHLDALARATGITAEDVMPLTKLYAGTKGVRSCRQAVELMDSGAQSPKETWLRLLLIDGGYPRPQTQIPLYEYGAVVANLDMGWPDIRVSVEYDGDQHRTDRATYVKDMRRAELIDRMGWMNVRVVKEDRKIDILARVADAWGRREREGLVVKSPKSRPGMLFRGF